MRLSAVSVFTAMMMATFSEEASGSPVETSFDLINSSAAVLPKAVFSSKMRLVLAVGVEGTGHSYFLNVDDHLFDANDDLVRLTSDENVDVGMYHILSSMGSNVQHYSSTIESARRAMRKLARHGEDPASPGTVVLLHGKYSYPDGLGVNKVMMYLDLRVLAEVAEAEGVDFRVVYLRRPVNGILVADTVHRHFQDFLGDEGKTAPEQRFMEYLQIMLTDIAVVHSFLAELDPAFVVCHDFSRVGESEQSSLVASFLAPNADVAERLKYSMIEAATVTHRAASSILPYDGVDVVSARLQRKFDAFESTLCSSIL